MIKPTFQVIPRFLYTFQMLFRYIGRANTIISEGCSTVGLILTTMTTCRWYDTFCMWDFLLDTCLTKREQPLIDCFTISTKAGHDSRPRYVVGNMLRDQFFPGGYFSGWSVAPMGVEDLSPMAVEPISRHCPIEIGMQNSDDQTFKLSVSPWMSRVSLVKSIEMKDTNCMYKVCITWNGPDYTNCVIEICITWKGTDDTNCVVEIRITWNGSNDTNCVVEICILRRWQNSLIQFV